MAIDENRDARKKKQKGRERDAEEQEKRNDPGRTPGSAEGERDEANPPRTTTGPLTAPKFGSAGSGGAELEPGPKKN